MDNLCHTLVGAALAQSGLKRRSPLGTATLLIAANLPDVDVISLAWGSTAGLAFRRGWTHGLLATALWPFLLAAAMVAYDRAGKQRGARFWPLAALAAVGVVSHPLLDLLNTYGVRLLMPFSSRWYYGDTLFIVDIWAWIILAAGVLLSVQWERRGRPAWRVPARAALGVAACYVAGMFVLGRLAAAQVRFEMHAAGEPVQRVLASPVPVTPLLREVVVDEGDRYLVGEIRTGGNFMEGGQWPKRNPDDERADPALALAASTPRGTAFLRWARYPTYIVDRRGGATVVHFLDLRYARNPDAAFGTLAVPVFDTQVASAAAIFR
jgi:inner membrane protein